jgi:hypothetical protein
MSVSASVKQDMMLLKRLSEALGRWGIVEKVDHKRVCLGFISTTWQFIIPRSLIILIEGSDDMLQQARYECHLVEGSGLYVDRSRGQPYKRLTRNNFGDDGRMPMSLRELTLIEKGGWGPEFNRREHNCALY